MVNVSSGTYWGRENQEKDGQIKKIHKWFAAQIWPILIRIGINDRTLRNGENIYWFYGVFWHLYQYGVESRICKIYLRGKLWQCGGKSSDNFPKSFKLARVFFEVNAYEKWHQIFFLISPWVAQNLCTLLPTLINCQIKAPPYGMVGIFRFLSYNKIASHSYKSICEQINYSTWQMNNNTSLIIVIIDFIYVKQNLAACIEFEWSK